MPWCTSEVDCYVCIMKWPFISHASMAMGADLNPRDDITVYNVKAISVSPYCVCVCVGVSVGEYMGLISTNLSFFITL